MVLCPIVMIYLTPLSWQMPGFLMKGIRKGLRREFDREPSRVEITGGYTEPDSVQRRSRLMHTVQFIQIKDRFLFIMDLPKHLNISFRTVVTLKQEKG